MLAILRCFWTDRAIWVKFFVILKLLEPLETLAKRAARSAASDFNASYQIKQVGSHFKALEFDSLIL